MAMKKVPKAIVYRNHLQQRIAREREYLRAIDSCVTCLLCVTARVSANVCTRAHAHTPHSAFIVYLHGTSSDAANVYFFMEYLPGGELFTRIHEGHDGRRGVRSSRLARTFDTCVMVGLRVSHARFYAGEIVLALEFLHGCVCVCVRRDCD
jgi:serine/threonine protein kinase